jgi:DNA adenine methylase
MQPFFSAQSSTSPAKTCINQTFSHNPVRMITTRQNAPNGEVTSCTTWDNRPTDHRLIIGEIVPIFRWAGSKRKTLACLGGFWNDTFERYVEPFVGSACLFLKLKPRAAILADLNSALIDAYETIRDKPRAVAEALYAIPRDSKTYYQVRRSYGTSTAAVERTAQFVYLNRNCFNGIFRTNLNGDFNVPFGTDQGQYPRLRDFETTSELLKNALLLRGDFGATLRHLRKGDFVYLDPPFAATGVRTFVEYGKRSFTEADINRLSRHLDRIDSRGAAFLVSYADCPRAREIAKKWNYKTIEVRRQIAGFSSKRKIAGELLISNLPLPPNA